MTHAGTMQIHSGQGQADLLQSLLQISIDLSATRDRRAMLERILTEARRLSQAQAGSLYVRRGNLLEFVVAQNDLIDVISSRNLLGKTVQIGDNSLAGFVAFSGRTLNFPDAYRIAPGAPFRINRDFDASTGYRTRSILAIPLRCPDGQVVGVLQLINRVDAGGAVIAFPDPDAALLSMASMAAVSVQNALLIDQLRQASLDSIIRLSVVAEFRDRNTADHIKRISRVSGALARAMCLGQEQVELIEAASPMHDIGKVGIPDSILLKPGPLTPEERSIVQTHTLIGADIMGSSPHELMAAARDIALSHHERWDGKGYPHRLKGERIPLLARIVCLADVFDALATRRCYKKAYPLGHVLEILKQETGKGFDPQVVTAFLGVFDEVAADYQTDAEPAA